MGSETTQPSLLSRVRDPSDADAWRQFDDKYRELILRYCRARGLQAADAEDVRQIAMANLAQRLRTFDYQPSRGRFRGYLGQVVRSAVARHFARPDKRPAALRSDVLAALPAAGDGDDALWEQEWMRHHFRLAMAHIRNEVDAKSVDIFERLLSGTKVDQVAADLDTTKDAVHKVKQRIRDRLKARIAMQIRAEDDPDGITTG